MKKMPWHRFGFLVMLVFGGTIGFRVCVNVPFASLSYTNSIAAVLLFAFWLYALRRITVGQGWEDVKAVLKSCTAWSRR